MNDTRYILEIGLGYLAEGHHTVYFLGEAKRFSRQESEHLINLFAMIKQTLVMVSEDELIIMEVINT